MNVSIIIPVYNVEHYIGNCLNSVIRQTYSGEMECLLINDACTDDSMIIVESLLADYQGCIDFRIIHHERNRGLSAARNTGTREAKGEFIYYLDSDDMISDDCIEKLMAVAKTDVGIELVQGNAEAVPARNDDIYNKRITLRHANSNEEVRLCFLKSDQMPWDAWNKLIRRDFLIKHHLWFQEGLLYEDMMWSFYLIKYLKKICFEPSVTYFHRKRRGSIMNGTDDLMAATHLKRINHEILTNLTDGFEDREVSFYAKSFAFTYVRYVKVLPELKEEFHLFWSKAKEFHDIKTCLSLVAIRLLGLFRWSWLLWPLMRRVKYPMVLLNDFYKKI